MSEHNPQNTLQKTWTILGIIFTSMTLLSGLAIFIYTPIRIATLEATDKDQERRLIIVEQTTRELNNNIERILDGNKRAEDFQTKLYERMANFQLTVELIKTAAADSTRTANKASADADNANIRADQALKAVGK